MTFNEAVLTLETMEACARRLADREQGVIGICQDQVWTELYQIGLDILNGMTVTCRENSCKYTIGCASFSREQFLLILTTHRETVWSRYAKRASQQLSPKVM